MKHNKMLCLLLAAVLLLGTLSAALAAALPVGTGQAAEPAPESSTAPTEEGTEATEVSRPELQRNPRRRQRRLSQRKRQNRRNLPPGKHCLQVFRLIRMLPWRKMRSVPKRL